MPGLTHVETPLDLAIQQRVLPLMTMVKTGHHEWQHQVGHLLTKYLQLGTALVRLR